MVPTEPTRARDRGWTETGDASWYGEPYHGRQTASGEVYDMYEMTAAHRSLPFDTVVRVTRRDTGADVTVRINDRGPFIKGRIIDLSLAAAREIGLDIDGVAPVKLKVVKTEAKRTNMPRRQPEQKPCLWVQVGAFGDGANARRAKRALEDAGEKALVIEGPDALERVRVGPFDEEREARRALDRLRADWPAARLVECGG
jgi:rare lipoprotein A